MELKIIEALSGAYDDGYRNGYAQALIDVNDDLQELLDGEQLIDSTALSVILNGLKNKKADK